MNFSMQYLLACLLISFTSLVFADGSYKIMQCNEGIKYDCSDCDSKRIDKKMHSFIINKSKNTVIFDEREKGIQVNSFRSNKCIITDQMNWMCYISIENNNDMYEETITHKMERGFYEFKASSPQGQARYCGIRTAN